MFMDISPGKFRAQMLKTDEAARQVLTGIFSRDLPPDRTLNDFFRRNRNCGSRDRKIIAAGIYSLLRFWGWMRKLPGEITAEIESGTVSLTAREMLVLIAGAVFVSGSDDGLFDNMRRELDIPAPRKVSGPLARIREFAAAVGLEKSFEMSDLIPENLSHLITPQLAKEDIYANLVRRPPMWLRVRHDHWEKVTAELEKNNIDFTRPFQSLPAVAVYSPAVNLFTLTSFREGLFEVQDLASMCIGAAAGAVPGQRWFDACAGAGGKTLMLAESMAGKGSILAGDIRERALENLRMRCRRAGYSNVSAKVHNGRNFKTRHPFDGVLLDVPCTGSGVWRRNPGFQWKLTPQQVEQYTATQQQILENFSPAVRCGGVLVYATCSMFEAENFRRIEQFLETHPGFELENFPHPLTGGPTGGMMQVNGAEFDCDWMFAARLRRNC